MNKPPNSGDVVRLTAQQGPHLPGSHHVVIRVVHHGGYTDEPFQVVLYDGSHVLAKDLELVPGNEWRPHEPCRENTALARLHSMYDNQHAFYEQAAAICGHRADQMIIDDCATWSPAQARSSR